MQKIAAALLWEIARVSFLPLLAAYVVMVMIAWALAFALSMSHDGQLVLDPDALFTFRVLILVNIIAATVVPCVDQVQFGHRYWFPVRTITLVTLEMLIRILLTVIETLLFIITIQAICLIKLPLAGPLLAAVMFSSLFQATWWFFEKTPLQRFAFLAPVFFITFWFNLRYRTITDLWVTQIDLDSIWAGLVVVVSYFAGLWCVERSRRGDQFRFPWPNIAANFGTTQQRSGHVLWKSLGQAQAWYYRRSTGWTIIIIAIIAQIVAVVTWRILELPPDAFIEVQHGIGIYFAMIASATMFFAGVLESQKRTWGIRQYIATKPISNRELGSSLLRFTLSNFVAAWSIIVIPIAIFCGWCRLQGIELSIFSRWGPGFGPLIMILTFTWVFMTVLYSVFLTGRPIIFWWMFFIPFTFNVIVSLLFDAHTSQKIWIAALSVVGVCLIVTAAIALFAARHTQLIGLRTLGFSVGVWAVASTIIMILFANHPSSDWGLCIYLIGMAWLPVIPCATFPLAIAWNRAR